MIEGAGWGIGVYDASATTAKNFATALEYTNNDSSLVKVLVDKH